MLLLSNGFSRPPTLGGMCHHRATSRANKQIVYKNERLQHQPKLRSRSLYTLFGAHCASLFSIFPYSSSIPLFHNLLVASQPSRKMTTLGCQVYIFYYALVNEHIYYNINFLTFQVKALRSASRASSI